MIVHKGNKYIIDAIDGIARKIDGKCVKEMKYYPERDIYSIAGEIDELTAWQIFHDIARQASESSYSRISPDHILINGKGFVLSDWSESSDIKFIAPEGYEARWALAATVFYVFLGCHVFQGLGGKGQTKSSPIPTMRRELTELSDITAQCLNFDPKRRPSLSELIKISAENIERCKKNLTEFPPLKPSEKNTIDLDEIDKYWPEKMS